jgi:Ni/Co efflux regulator RcnB
MMNITRQKGTILVLVIAGILLITSTSLAEKPSWAGGGDKGGKQEQKKKHDSNEGPDAGYSDKRDGDDEKESVYFGDQQRNVIRNFYAEQYRSGNCPPGLAKMNNGCMPPGQARKWQVGRPLPSDVKAHDLPHNVIEQLGLPPAGHRFIRVASDVLLINEGSGLIIDAIQYLSEN